MHWVAVGALALAAAGFAALGRWQLERAGVNRAISLEYESTSELPPLEQPVAEAEDAAETERFRYRPMRLRGHYVPESQVLLDNMTSHGVAGYQVLTPFRVAGDVRADGEALVLINRGWVPASPDRRELPDVALAAEGEVVVSGRVDRLPRAALELESPATDARAPLTVLSYPDFAAIEAALGTPVHHFQLLLDPAAPAGFVREWAPPADRANRNIAYAVQWFGLALLAFGIALGIAWKSRRGAREIPA
jgi:surfeit locus 1 family protein